METYAINIQGRLLSLAEPVVMGIINVTPDSFAVRCGSDDTEAVMAAAARAIEEGAAILDVGAYSSRPGAAEVSAEEEWRRLSLALSAIRSRYLEIPISVDTFRADIARRCVKEYGVGIINDISGGELDEQMFAAVAESGAAYVLMHMRGTPETMSSLTHYDEDIMSSLFRYFAQRIDRLHELGVKDIIIDPGFGFAKTTEQNFELLRRLGELRELGLPILAGLSRKSMIYKTLSATPDSAAALNGTTALNMMALRAGAKILRVHDVREAVETIKLYKALCLA